MDTIAICLRNDSALLVPADHELTVRQGFHGQPVVMSAADLAVEAANYRNWQVLDGEEWIAVDSDETTETNYGRVEVDSAGTAKGLRRLGGRRDPRDRGARRATSARDRTVTVIRTQIVTYRLAYLDQQVDLCASCVAIDDHDCGALGPVTHGIRRGACEGKRHDAGLAQRVRKYSDDVRAEAVLLRILRR